MFDGAVHWRCLLDNAAEGSQCRFHLLQADAGGVLPLGNLAAGVISIGGYPEFNLGPVRLGGIGKEFDNACRLPEADRKYTGGHRVEGSGMTHATLAAEPFHQRYHAVRGDTPGFVYVQNAIHI